MRFSVILDLLLVAVYVYMIAIYVYMLPYLISMLLTSLAAIIDFSKTRKKSEPARREIPTDRRFLVAIPAQNEEANIAETVRSCRAIDYPASRFDVLVIADNCTDRTAARAREAGARVIERFDESRRSKGYAITYLIQELKRSGEFDGLDALVIIDADSTVDPDILRQFALGLDRGSEWMQCYDCVGNADRSWRTRIMAYGFSLYNGITLAGRQAMGMSASLRGNGMCLSTSGLRRVPWNAHGLAEDLEYSWILRIAGGRIEFVKDASVFATMLIRGGSSLDNQRRRWEYGRKAVGSKMLGPLLRSHQLPWPRKAADLVELTSPPTSHLAFHYLFVWLLAVIVSLLAFFNLHVIVSKHQYLLLLFVGVCHTIATVALLVHALSPFLTSLLPWRFALSLGYFPCYLLWKLRVLAQGRPDRWVGTAREGDSSPNTGGELLAVPAFRAETRHERVARRDA